MSHQTEGQMLQSAMPDIQRRLSSGTRQVRDALNQVRNDCAAAGLDQSQNATAQIILAEVLNNVVEHAYSFDEGLPIDLSIWFRDGGMWCEVVDEGQAMPGNRLPAGVMPDINLDDIDSLPEGGFGWAMVLKMTHDIRYLRVENRNHLEFLIPA